ncbi:hypothetical protein F5141DRAFT_1066361 [Pisolithus sp. B1]|nr:hypothetical protein F5141DRAFT_1066361 [Pisolithus sp. B1]
MPAAKKNVLIDLTYGLSDLNYECHPPSIDAVRQTNNLCRYILFNRRMAWTVVHRGMDGICPFGLPRQIFEPETRQVRIVPTAQRHATYAISGNTQAVPPVAAPTLLGRLLVAKQSQVRHCIAEDITEAQPLTLALRRYAIATWRTKGGSQGHHTTEAVEPVFGSKVMVTRNVGTDWTLPMSVVVSGPAG